MPVTTLYDEAIRVIAQQLIKEEVERYLHHIAATLIQRRDRTAKINRRMRLALTLAAEQTEQMANDIRQPRPKR